MFILDLQTNFFVCFCCGSTFDIVQGLFLALCSGVIPLLNSARRNNVKCQKPNQGSLYARKVSYFLYYVSGPLKKS